MRQEWQDKIAASDAMLNEALGAPDPRLRCAARFGKAVTRPINEWYADELARGTEPAVMLQVLPRFLGQMLGIQLHNAGGHPELVAVVANLLGIEIAETLRKAQAGVFDAMTVPNPGGRT